MKRNDFRHLAHSGNYNNNRSRAAAPKKLDIIDWMKFPDNYKTYDVCIALLDLVAPIHPNYIDEEIHRPKYTFIKYWVSGKRLFTTNSAEELELLIADFQRLHPDKRLVVVRPQPQQ